MGTRKHAGAVASKECYILLHKLVEKFSRERVRELGFISDSLMNEILRSRGDYQVSRSTVKRIEQMGRELWRSKTEAQLDTEAAESVRALRQEVSQGLVVAGSVVENEVPAEPVAGQMGDYLKATMPEAAVAPRLVVPIRERVLDAVPTDRKDPVELLRQMRRDLLDAALILQNEVAALEKAVDEGLFPGILANPTDHAARELRTLVGLVARELGGIEI